MPRQFTEQNARDKDMRAGGTPAMQHRHFAFIASVLRTTKPSLASSILPMNAMEEWQHICEMFAIRLARSNPNFDRGRFLAACEPEEG